MKLVDILARELKVWPFGGHFAWQDYDKEVRFSPDSKHDFHMSELAEDNVRPCHGLNPLSGVTRAEWQAAVDALNAPKVVEWDGVGLPPVGSASCEYLGAHKYDEWTIVNIFAHYGHTVFVDFGDGWRAEDDSSRFRPIRTAEQVAAEEREKEIADMMEVTSDGITCMDRDDALALYKAGYRKQVAK